MTSTRPKTSSNLVNNLANNEHTPKNIHGRYCDKTYCSLMALEFVQFLRRRWTGTVTNWCPVALLGVTETITERVRNNNLNKRGAIMGCLRNIPVWKDKYHCRTPLPTAPDYVRGWHWQRALEYHQPKGTKRRVTTARRRLDGLRVSTSFGTTSQLKKIIKTSVTLMEIPSIYRRPERSQIKINVCHKLDAKHIGGLCTRLGTSSQNVARSTSISLPQTHGTQANASPGWATGFPGESNTKTQ